MIDNSWNELGLKLARDARNEVNNYTHKELVSECIEDKINYKKMTDDEMRAAIKKVIYDDLHLNEEEIKVLNREKRLTDKMISNFKRKQLEKECPELKDKIITSTDSDKELFDFINSKKQD